MSIPYPFMVYYAYFGISAVGIGLSDECCMSTFELDFHFTSPSVGDDLAVFSFPISRKRDFLRRKYFSFFLRYLQVVRFVCPMPANIQEWIFSSLPLAEASTYRWQQMLGGDMTNGRP